MLSHDTADEPGMESWQKRISRNSNVLPLSFVQLRASGVRDWINSMFASEKRAGPQHQELFNCATLDNFEISKTRSGDQSERRLC